MEWEKKHSSLNSRTVCVLLQEIKLSLFLIIFQFIFKTNIKVSTLKIWAFFYTLQLSYAVQANGVQIALKREDWAEDLELLQTSLDIHFKWIEKK